jgi:hypothetical protein
MSKTYNLGDGPVEEKYRQAMEDLARDLDRVFNGELRGDDRTTGFVLMVFPFRDTEGRCNYISNGADRNDIVALMKEMIQRFEGQPEMRGRA